MEHTSSAYRHRRLKARAEPDTCRRADTNNCRAEFDEHGRTQWGGHVLDPLRSLIRWLLDHRCAPYRVTPRGLPYLVPAVAP